jgi:hypothetical protein
MKSSRAKEKIFQLSNSSPNQLNSRYDQYHSSVDTWLTPRRTGKQDVGTPLGCQSRQYTGPDVHDNFYLPFRHSRRIGVYV